MFDQSKMINTDYVTPDKNKLLNFQKALNDQSSMSILCSVTKLRNNNVKLKQARSIKSGNKFLKNQVIPSKYRGITLLDKMNSEHGETPVNMTDMDELTK